MGWLALSAAGSALAAFTDNGDGTVTDTVTGLMWDKCSWGQSGNTCASGADSVHGWAQALGVAVTANAGNHKGHADWRLPNRTELESLVKIDASSPAIDTTAFPNTRSGQYWTATTYAPGTASAWYVDFLSGSTGINVKAFTYNVRLVRSGQSFAAFDRFGDITPPSYQSASLNGSNTVATLTFNEGLVNNLADLAALKAATTFAADGTTFTALAGGDAVAISGSTVTVTFATALAGSTNKIRINANSLKDAAGNVLSSAVTTAALAASAPAPVPEPEPTVVIVYPGGTVTLTKAIPVQATAGSTLIITDVAAVAGVVITLPAPSAGGKPVTIKINGQVLTLMPGSANTVITLQKIRFNGVDTLVPVIVSGGLTVSANNAQPLLMLGNGGLVLSAGPDGGSLTWAVGNGQRLGVSMGYVNLPAGFFAQSGSFAATRDDRLYAGEVATLDANGKISGIRLGTLDGDSATASGDPLARANKPGNLSLPVIPNLNGDSPRANGKLAQAIADSLKATLEGAGQNASGALVLNAGGTRLAAMPVGEVKVLTARGDGTTLHDNGQVEVAVKGVVTTFVPALADIDQLAAGLPAGSALSVNAQGIMRLGIDGVTYFVRPIWGLGQGAAKGLSIGAENLRFTDGQGNGSTLAPSFADYDALLQVIGIEVPGGTAKINADGTLSITVNGNTSTLVPEMIQPKIGNDGYSNILNGKRWWRTEDGRLILNVGGALQGFTVR